MLKKTTLIIAAFLMIFIFNHSSSYAATFDDINQGNVFLNQEGKSTCTLCSSAMMMRRAAMLSGNSNWSSITESSLKSSAWVSGSGLKWSFSYAGISVQSATLPTGQSNINILKNMLAQHPEGIVLHYKGAPHAVLLTDYTNGTFYCSDPLSSRPRARIPLSQAYKVTATNATRYWYVSSPSCQLSQTIQAAPEVVKVNEPSGYEITINKTLLTVKENLVATINPYDNNITKYTFVILKNGSVYKTIDNGTSKTLTYNITSPGNYQIYGKITNAGGTFSGSASNGGLDFEVTDQILTGFDVNYNESPGGFDASKGITITVTPHDNIEATNYKFTIYKENSDTSEYEFYKNVDNGDSNTYHFSEPAGNYSVKITVSNRVGYVTYNTPEYLKAVSDTVLGVNLEYSSSELCAFEKGSSSTMKLNAAITPSTALNKNVSWKSSNPNVVTVDNNGNLTAVGYGFSLITVCTEDGNFIAELPVKINGFGIMYGDVSGDGKITITDLAALSQCVNGEYTPTENQKMLMDLDGDAVLTDEDVEIINQYLLHDEYIFPVETQVNNISILSLPKKTEYHIGEKLDFDGLKLQVQYNDGTTNVISDGFDYTGNTNVCGKQNIVISYCEDEVKKTAQFSINVSKYEQNFAGSTEYDKIYGDSDFALDTVLSEGDGKISYQSSDENIVEVTNDGVVQIKSSGIATITVSVSETDKYKANRYEVKITVDKANQVITGTNSYEKNNNSELFLLDTKIVTGDGQLSYYSQDDSVAIVNNIGKVAITGIGNCNIVVKASETANYKETIFNITLNVSENTSDKTENSSETPEVTPSNSSTPEPTNTPEVNPTGDATAKPTDTPEVTPTGDTTAKPTNTPDVNSSDSSTAEPTNTPDVNPAGNSTTKPTDTPEVNQNGNSTNESSGNTTVSHLKKQKITTGTIKNYKSKKLKKKKASFSLNAKTSGDGKLTYAVIRYP